MAEEVTQAEPQAEGGGKKYAKSTIKFPYYDLDAAIDLVRTIHSERGNQSSLDDLVGVLPNFSTVESGAFRQLIAAAALCGLIDVGGREVTLTNRAYQIMSPDEEVWRRARADAFLGVPLFRAIFDQHRGRALPPRVGMQRTIEQLGVVKSLAERAYGAFSRSAEQAGFFQAGRQYLVQPTLRRAGGQERSAEPGPGTGTATAERDERVTTSGGATPPTGIHPAIMGLLQLLPADGVSFPKEARQTWLQAVGGALDLIYGTAEPAPTKPEEIGGEGTD